MTIRASKPSKRAPTPAAHLREKTSDAAHLPPSGTLQAHRVSHAVLPRAGRGSTRRCTCRRFHFRATAVASDPLLFSAVGQSAHLHWASSLASSRGPPLRRRVQACAAVGACSGTGGETTVEAEESVRFCQRLRHLFRFNATTTPMQLFFPLQSAFRQASRVLHPGAARCGWQQSTHFRRRPGSPLRLGRPFGKPAVVFHFSRSKRCNSWRFSRRKDRASASDCGARLEIDCDAVSSQFAPVLRSGFLQASRV